MKTTQRIDAPKMTHMSIAVPWNVVISNKRDIFVKWGLCHGVKSSWGLCGVQNHIALTDIVDIVDVNEGDIHQRAGSKLNFLERHRNNSDEGTQVADHRADQGNSEYHFILSFCQTTDS